MIKVVMERHCTPGKGQFLAALLIDLRARAMRQKGYISGETFVRADDPSWYLTIGTWARADAWKAWEKSEERLELTRQIDALLTDTPKTTVYTPFVEQAVLMQDTVI